MSSSRAHSFLAYVDLLGTTFSAPTLATGYGAHLAQPLMRKAVEGREGLISRQEAEELADRCMRVLFYRDARSINKVRGWGCLVVPCSRSASALLSFAPSADSIDSIKSRRSRAPA